MHIQDARKTSETFQGDKIKDRFDITIKFAIFFFLVSWGHLLIKCIHSRVSFVVLQVRLWSSEAATEGSIGQLKAIHEARAF